MKNIIIGSVPDRGGRANEMRPKASDIGFNRDNGSGHKGNRNAHAVSRDKGTSGKQSHQQDKKPADAMDVDDLAPVNSSNYVAVTKGKLR